MPDKWLHKAGTENNRRQRKSTETLTDNQESGIPLSDRSEKEYIRKFFSDQRGFFFSISTILTGFII